jgi:hypothetical protein
MNDKSIGKRVKKQKYLQVLLFQLDLTLMQNQTHEVKKKKKKYR